MDSPLARKILGVLAENWPDQADLEKVVIQVREPAWIVVSVWTATPELVIGQRGSVASEMRERLGRVVPADKNIEFRVLTGTERPGPSPSVWADYGSEASEVRLREETGVLGEETGLLRDETALLRDETGLLRDETGLAPRPPGHDLVPDLVGLTVREAHAKARSSGYFLATGDPDGIPISFSAAHREYGHWVVMSQSPVPSVLAPLHSAIVVTIEERGGGGESGDREPRVPRPPRGMLRFEQPIDHLDFEYVEGVE